MKRRRADRMRVKGRSPKVCLACLEYPPDRGGVARSAGRIAKYLVEEGFDVHVFTPKRGEPQGLPPEPFLQDGAKVYRVASGLSLSTEGITGAIQAADDAVSFDIFHGVYLPMAYPCMLTDPDGLRPLIASIQGSDAVEWGVNPVYRELMTAVLKRASWVTSVNTDYLRTAADLADISGRSSFIPNGVDSAAFPRWRPTEANRGVVGTVTVFRDVKNIPLLIQSYAGVDARVRKRLLLVGDFPEGDENERFKVREAIRRHKVGREVRVTGYVGMPQISENLLAMRVFVLCSKHEGLPNAVLEAAAAGVPIVSLAVGGVKDVLRDGESGLLVAPGDEDGLTAAIQTALKDQRLAEGLSLGGLKVARDLSLEAEKRHWIGLYSLLLGTR